MKRSTLLIATIIASMAFFTNTNAQRRAGGGMSTSGSSGSSTSTSTRSSSDNGGGGSMSSSGSDSRSGGGSGYRSASDGGRSSNDYRSSGDNSRGSGISNQGDRGGYRSASDAPYDRKGRPNEVKVRDRHMRMYPNDRAVYVAHRSDRFIGPDPGYVRIHHHGMDYGYHSGRYYVFRDGGYVVTTPPRGIRVSVIPNGFFTINVGRVPYYYYGGAYYRRDIALNNYEVVDPPMGAIVPELPSEDVNTVVVNGRTYLEYDGILYKTVVTRYGIQYKVMGRFNDVDSVY